MSSLVHENHRDSRAKLLNTDLLYKRNQFVILSKSIYFAFASAACIYETSVSQHIIPTSATPSTIVRKQEDNHGFSADKRGGYLPLK